MKTIKSVSVGSFTAYGAILAAFWVFVFGVWYWILGWIFGAQSWWIDMNLGNWTIYSLTTFGFLFIRAVLAAVGGALAGLVLALVTTSWRLYEDPPSHLPLISVIIINKDFWLSSWQLADFIRIKSTQDLRSYQDLSENSI